MNINQLNENEYNPYFKFYIEKVGNAELIEVLKTSFKEFSTTIKNLPEEKLMYRYAKGKWTIKELIQHLIDTERILSYRALRFSRNDATEIQGFDENWYVNNSNANDRNIMDILEEFNHLRKTSISLFKSFSDEMLINFGTADRNKMSVRALGFIIAGHQLHHLKIIKERYL
ncbi:MAG: DinB family protein [Lutibacter sp.]|uniref:DinB family protein n=1 Tax=Lutibacter sp. TaxID=1925666 RepID=UPI00385B7AA0